MSATTDDLNPRAIAGQLTKYLTCPIDWSLHVTMHPVEQVLYRKWFYTVADVLPGGSVDVQCLRNKTDEYCREPAEDSYEMMELLSDDGDISEASLSDSKRIAESARYYHEVFVKAYLRDCGRLHKIRAQTSAEREKHYALNCVTTDQVRQYSRKRRDIDIMFPTLTPQLQEYAFWLSIERMFEDIEWEAEADIGDDLSDHRRSGFELAWKQLLGEVQSFRFCLNSLGPVGFYNGQLANFLIFDVSLQSDIFHCYPALAPIPDLPVACVDHLQGLDTCFEEKRPFPFP